MPIQSRPKLLTSMLWYRFVMDAIKNSGLDAQKIALDAGLDTSLLAFPEATVPDELFFNMMKLAQTYSGNQDYGLHTARFTTLAAFGALSYSMMSAADLRGALERTMRYSRTMTQATSSQLHTHQRGAVFELFLVSPNFDDSRQAFEFFSLYMLNFLRWMCGGELNPLEVELPHPAPADISAHQKLFGCPIRFGTKRITMLFSTEQLSMPLLTADAVMSEVHDQYAEVQMLSFGSAPYSQQIRRLIIQKLPDGEPTRLDIAKHFHISERTLQRRLQDEGIQYNKLLNEIRRNLAEMHLTNSHITLQEVGSLLGFTEQSSFTRATNRWFGKSPSQVRSALLASPRA